MGFEGTGHQVRDCLHARDLLPLIRRQMELPSADAPRVVNCSGGVGQSASLRQLSTWCEERFGGQEIAAEKQGRPFDVPWLVLDSRLAQCTWQWQPQTSLEKTWEEIAEHADKNPRWLEMTAAS
jgi:CDP-paratose 2-epimerase